MTIKIQKKNGAVSLRSRIEKISGVDLSKCYQCKKCSSGCPVSNLTKSSPAEMIRRLHLGAEKGILENDLTWLCLSCETCYERCPMQINFAAVIDAMRSIALEEKAASPEGNMPLFNRLFLDTVRSFGRVYDLPAIALYKLGTFNLKQDMDNFPVMLKKGKMALMPPSGADKSTVKRIFSKAKQEKGNNR